jgi:hypothetical protein
MVRPSTQMFGSPPFPSRAGILGVAGGTCDGGRARDGYRAAEAITSDGVRASQPGDLVPAGHRLT